MTLRFARVEIWGYYQSTRQARVELLQNVEVFALSLSSWLRDAGACHKAGFSVEELGGSDHKVQFDLSRDTRLPCD